MKLNTLLIIGLSGTIVFSSCKKDEEDTTAPTLTNLKVNGADHHVEIDAGNTLNITGSISDDIDLAQYKVDIHDAFDGHGHKDLQNFSHFNYQHVHDVSGTSHSLDHSVSVDASAMAGPYHCIVTPLDAAGNEGDPSEVEFMISNSGQASVNITSPDFSSEHHQNAGTTLSIQGTVTDDIDIDEIVVELKEEEGHSHKSGEIYHQDFDLPGASDTSWDFQTDGMVDISIPGSAETGHYVLMVTVVDSDGNMTFFEGEVHIM